MESATTKPQFIVTPGGEEMVVVPRADYERLAEAAEMLSDVEALRRANARIEAGEDEDLPAAMVRRMLAGENPVRVWREHRDMSVAELAAKAGISRSSLGQIESGREDAFSTMSRIAATLGIMLDDLDRNPPG